MTLDANMNVDTGNGTGVLVEGRLHSKIDDVVKLIRGGKYKGAKTLADSLVRLGVPREAVNSECCPVFDHLKYHDRKKALELAMEFFEYDWYYWLSPRTTEEEKFIREKRVKYDTTKRILMKLGLNKGDKYV